MKKGARQGLLECALIQELASPDEVQAAFEGVYNFLNSSLTDQQKASITFDVFIVEHLLCKYQRVDRKA